MKSIRSMLVSILILIILGVACSKETPRNDSFQIVILNKSWLDLDLGYTYDKALPILLNLDTTDNLFVVSLQDIEKYDWDNQTITLTQNATNALAKALVNATHGPESAVTNMHEELGWGSSFENALYIKTFVVKIDGTPLYGGIFIQPYSQMAISYPVMRIYVKEKKARISIVPFQSFSEWGK